MGKENVIFFNVILFSYNKEENPAIFKNTDGSWGHYAKRNKSDKERQILSGLTYNVESRKTELIETENRLVVARGGGWGLGEKGEGGQRVHTSSYKINRFWEYNVLHGDYSWQYCIVYLEVARRVDFKSSHRKKKNL